MVTLEQNDGMSTIRLEGPIDIASAGELKALLIEALQTGNKVPTPAWLFDKFVYNAK